MASPTSIHCVFCDQPMQPNPQRDGKLSCPRCDRTAEPSRPKAARAKPAPNSSTPRPAGLPRLAPGGRIGEYEIMRELGGGGMGKVYLARHTKLKSDVAVKVLAPQMLNDAEALTRFQREIAAVGPLAHPNIVRATYAGEDCGMLYLVMEYVEGRDLAQLLRQRGQLPASEACALVSQAAAALQYASERGLIHRDIKPSNLMVTTDGTLKVLDFGLARLRENDAPNPLTSTGVWMGTPDYLAPEQITSARDVDIRADIYSLGCTLFYLLAGRPPMPGRTRVEKFNGHLQGKAEPLETLCPELPAELVAVVRKMMARDADQRYTMPAEVVTALSAFITGSIAPQRSVAAASASHTLQPRRAATALPWSDTSSMPPATPPLLSASRPSVPPSLVLPAAPSNLLVGLLSAGIAATLLLSVVLGALLLRSNGNRGDHPQERPMGGPTIGNNAQLQHNIAHGAGQWQGNGGQPGAAKEWLEFQREMQAQEEEMMRVLMDQMRRSNAECIQMLRLLGSF
jgi:serine/threonine protein kinase